METKTNENGSEDKKYFNIRIKKQNEIVLKSG